MLHALFETRLSATEYEAGICKLFDFPSNEAQNWLGLHWKINLEHNNFTVSQIEDGKKETVLHR